MEGTPKHIRARWESACSRYELDGIYLGERSSDVDGFCDALKRLVAYPGIQKVWQTVSGEEPQLELARIIEHGLLTPPLCEMEMTPRRRNEWLMKVRAKANDLANHLQGTQADLLWNASFTIRKHDEYEEPLSEGLRRLPEILEDVTQQALEVPGHTLKKPGDSFAKRKRLARTLTRHFKEVLGTPSIPLVTNILEVAFDIELDEDRTRELADWPPR